MSESLPDRPERVAEEPLPPFPHAVADDEAATSTAYSEHRTKLSRHRTGLSEHRTQLSEHRTDLSTFRTSLSTNRTEMSKRRTGMSFQRTRMSADRTLMSVIRTSLSLISFGFTIFQFFQKLREADLVASAHEPRMFGMALVWLGIGMLVMGIIYHVHFMLGLRKTRVAMTRGTMIHGESGFPVSVTLIAAVVLLLIGVLAIFYMLS
ncbi:MAG: YidH family protein [Steroidobacteraceae bacterium]